MQTKSDNKYILDATKIAWHHDRILEWKRGKRIAPITIDMALTRACNYGCHFCYARLQENDRFDITREHIDDFLDDCKELGVRAISLVSDGESTLSPHFEHTVIRGSELGISMAVATHGFNFKYDMLERILPHLTYLRVNFSAGEPKRYAEIMGVREGHFHRVVQNVKDMVEIKKRDNLDVTIGLQMVLMPEDADQVVPLAKIGKEIRPDYLVVKHTSDSEDGKLGVDYSKYAELQHILEEAESYSDETYQVSVKWSKINAEGKRSYQRCYAAPFQIQISGSGLIAPCGMLFNEKYKRFHIGNITKQRFKDIVLGDKYWEVMQHLASMNFDAQKMCGSLCLQHKPNEFLDNVEKGKVKLEKPTGKPPAHLNFI
ncbi:radical SAM protein [Pseudoalteromonas luteoviolacea S2607]|uniref:radical SAM protein n=1 Tax=Pseudoalteromonas luteoviolacea TaxID=43657 RepID=UPI0007B03E73|nr:radical SAM protein [Pseudoalteromonas luteoviolacea]KZN39506.1 radical SAM protein [Pseudoalteromonas luteoviolacea S2607]